MNREEYLNYLSSRYAEDPNYISKVKQIIEKEKKK
jgi:flagellum-specific peptidoglycan hydrolase FlgJ